MGTVFWDSKGIILIDYLEKEKMLTRQYYINLLGCFNAKLKEKGSHLSKKKVLFHHGNVPAHSFAIAASKLVEL